LTRQRRGRRKVKGLGKFDSTFLIAKPPSSLLLLPHSLTPPSSTISDIATTFLGMFYIGYMPSFWVKIRPLGSTPAFKHTRISHLVAPFLSLIGQNAAKLPAWMPKTVPLPVTQGSIYIFWCWICIAFADVGAYFTGKNLGRTPLGALAPAAGATSPNKTVEGLIGGCVVSGGLGMLGAWVQNWPRWYLTGAWHGVMLALLGLVGDLTASMLKRDAGLKDFGDLIPEHGGVLDRVDSFIFSAPYSYFVIKWCLPFWKKIWGVP
jgi:CDP-diglyceride synthetase